MLNTTQVYMEHEGKVLMLFRNKKENDMNEGKWIAPGGKCEEGESPLDCAIREVMEETGYLCHEPRYRAVVEFHNDIYPSEVMHIFTCDSFEMACEPVSDEGTLEWIDKDEILELNLWEGDRYYLKEMMKRKDFFTMKLYYSKDVLKKVYLEGKEIYEQ